MLSWQSAPGRIPGLEMGAGGINGGMWALAHTIIHYGIEQY